MITTKPFFLFLLVLGISLFLVADHIINYETWGDNENFFVNDYQGFKVKCEINYFAEPTNCKVIDENGIQVSNEILMLKVDECYRTENNNILPCILD